jgi:hypothetical protein
VLENVFFPAQVLASLRLDDKATVTAVRLFLTRFREEAGPPRDGVERILLDQVVVAHLKVGELYALAAATSKLEFKQLYSNAAVRLLEVLCRLVTTLTSYRASASRRRRPGRRAKAPATPAPGEQAATAKDPGASHE